MLDGALKGRLDLLTGAERGEGEAAGGGFFRAAFFLAVDEVGTAIGSRRGLRQGRGESLVGTADFEALLQHNRLSMIDCGRHRVEGVRDLPEHLAIRGALDILVAESRDLLVSV